MTDYLLFRCQELTALTDYPLLRYPEVQDYHSNRLSYQYP